MTERLILLRYGEIHLKGLNRPFFKRLLKNNLAQALGGLGCTVYEQHGRVYVSGYRDQDEGDVIARCRRTFGVVGVCPALCVDKEMDAIALAAAAQLVEAARLGKKEHSTFKVHARREDKTFSPNSMGIAREVGARLLKMVEGGAVDVHRPDVTIEVEVRERAYVYAAVLPAVGGMPTGSSGGGMLMLSGGIDSPVAGYMMARRGMRLSAVHFESPPHTGEAARAKVVELARILSGYCGPVTLYVVGFTQMQETLYLQCRPNLLTVLMRRAMIDIAQTLARQNGDMALITGESLGQVASQTLEAIVATDDVARMPVFRPLIGMDKDAIVQQAKAIDTFDISIRPGEDCCTVFVPKHPATRPTIPSLEQEEGKIPYAALIAACVDGAQRLDIRPQEF